MVCSTVGNGSLDQPHSESRHSVSSLVPVTPYHLLVTDLVKMPLQQGAVFLITGCSTGLGRAFAETALKRGYRVIATARKLESIQDLKDKGASILKLDTTASEDELHAFAKEAWHI